MCGIAGLYSPTGTPNPELVDAMRAAVAHRGPDEGSTDSFGRCVLGHQRLRVIDLETGYQPVANETGDVVCVFNGEAYNFAELRTELAAHEIRGTGDTPVLPHAYEENGPGFVQRLDGMFALALWDAGRERLVLARDRLGKKPLVWTRLPDGTLAFASELKALLRLPDVRRDVDVDAVDRYLALQYVPGDATGIAGIHRLPPGHVLIAEGESLRIERYWTPAPAALSPRRDEEWLELVRDSVRDAVGARLVADVPLGALLSGGIDSSIVVALMAQHATGPVRTFTVGFGDARYDERDYARAVVERYGTSHEELEIDAAVPETVERLADAFDEPLGDEAAFPTFLICEQARRHVTVALTGDGGDEAFAGYERYAAYRFAAPLPPSVAGVGARALGAMRAARTEPRSQLFRARRFLDIATAPRADRYARLMEVFPRGLRTRLWADGRAAPIELRPRARGTRGLQLLDLETYLRGDLLPKADIASMAHSLELRSPFLDHRVVELGLALPDSLKTRGLTGKVALRRAFADALPRDVGRRGKTGFGVPLDRWFREELRELARDVLPGDRGWFRPAEVRRLLDEHDSGHADHGHRLWCLLMLELWARRHVEAPALAAA
ncbi:MAG: asparagine synthase (glutamine-hydrolyzing) [Gaiellaceae bacterium]